MIFMFVVLLYAFVSGVAILVIEEVINFFGGE